MKKTFLFLLFAAFAIAATAQDYSKVMLNYQLKKYEDAKSDIDKLSTDSKAQDKPETYLWKAAIYGQLYADSALTGKYPDAAQQSMAAFNTYLQKDPSLKMLKEGNASAAINGLAWLYSASFNNGKKYFTESKWPEAFQEFKRATELSEFINKNGFNSNKSLIDTFTVLYTGYAAQNMGKPDSAVAYYEKLADLKTGGADLQPMYQYMLDDYSKMNQPEKFTKYLAIAKELYPDKANLWSQMEMSNMSQNASLDQIMTKYQQDSATTLTEDQLVNYAETFANPQQLQSLDSNKQVQYKLTAAGIYKRAFNQNPNQGIYAYNAGLLNYNIFNDLEDRRYALRGESAALKTQRTEVEKQQQVYADSAIAWLEKGYEILKAKTDRDRIEANSLDHAVDYLANLYMWKREQTKGTNSAAATKDYDKYDAKFKQFDAEHGKYKM
ncbi:hypothetical protein FC093_09715 [Ilyomonas limi]|uniref:Tetratricopeptide repeat protein n=1 Tax=Ilyomonas limi TaxID=2575867 RepID=A0A4U3L1F0_9BACT|nr:hypothetical protein [Ilyomonas limi]TKK68961.1 hypothetical protein FC093_09715 [Ilyomonas limi]